MPTLWLGIGLSIIMLANCWLAHRQLLELPPHC
jgi:hypothetical protein